MATRCMTGPEFRQAFRRDPSTAALHAADRMFTFGAGTIHLCADTSMVKDVQRLQGYLKTIDANARLAKGTTNPSLLKQYIQQVGAEGLLQDLYRFENGLPEDHPINPAEFASFKDHAGKQGKDGYLFRISKMVYSKLLTALDGAPLSAEVDYEPGVTTVSQIVEQGVAISGIDPTRIVVKVPVADKDTIEAIGRLENDHGVRVNATLLFTLQQAWEAAQAGATYLSPFAGRVDDYMIALAMARAGGRAEGVTSLQLNSGMDFVDSVVNMIARESLPSMIIPASVRKSWKQVQQPTNHLQRIYDMSLHASVPLVPTIPTEVIEDPANAEMLWMFHRTTQGKGYAHPKLAEGLRGFTCDGKAWQAEALKVFGSEGQQIIT